MNRPRLREVKLIITKHIITKLVGQWQSGDSNPGPLSPQSRLLPIVQQKSLADSSFEICLKSSISIHLHHFYQSPSSPLTFSSSPLLTGLQASTLSDTLKQKQKQVISLLLQRLLIVLGINERCLVLN